MRSCGRTTTHWSAESRHVQYQYVRLPDENFLRVQHAVALRNTPSPNPEPRLPGTLSIFPGISARFPLNRGAQRLFAHHVTVRELTSKRFEVYTHLWDSNMRRAEASRVGRTEPIVGEANLLYLGHMRIKDRRVLDSAGLAMTPLSADAEAALAARGELWPERQIANHPAFDLTGAENLPQRNHMWTGYFLASKPPNDSELRMLARFFFHTLPGLVAESPEDAPNLAKIDYIPDFDGDVPMRTNLTDFSVVGRKARIPHLLTLTAVIPGAMDAGMAVAFHPVDLTKILSFGE